MNVVKLVFLFFRIFGVFPLYFECSIVLSNSNNIIIIKFQTLIIILTTSLETKNIFLI